MKKVILIALMNLVTIMSFAQDLATYEVRITSQWNAKDHLGLPGPAHFSPVVAVSHTSSYQLMPLGGITSPGLELVAELGRTSQIESEIQEAKARGFVSSRVITENQFVKRQPVQTFEITVSREHPYLSLVSMIAPSPDWIIGLDRIQLYNEQIGFLEVTSQVPLYALDAGTENGDFGGNFSLNNSPTIPQTPIQRLRGPGFEKEFATVSIRRIR